MKFTISSLFFVQNSPSSVILVSKQRSDASDRAIKVANYLPICRCDLEICFRWVTE